MMAPSWRDRVTPTFILPRPRRKGGIFDKGEESMWLDDSENRRADQAQRLHQLEEGG